MSDPARNVLVGLTSIAGLVCLAVILMLFGYVPPMLKRGYVVNVELNHAAGLGQGSRIRLSGIDVGQVQQVRLQEPPKRGVVVVAFIKPDVPVPRGAKAGVEAQLIGGGAALSFDIDHLTAEELGDLLPTDGSATISGRVPTLASLFAAEMRAAFDKPFTQFEKLMTHWTQLGENLNRLVEPPGAAEDGADNATGNLGAVLARADARLTELKGVLEGLSRWVNDAELRDNVRATASGAVDATQKLGAGAERLGKLADELNEKVDRLTARYVAVADDLSKAIGSLQQAIDKAHQGDGTVGKLLNDAALYNNINDTVQRAEAALKELQLLIEKWKKEGVPVNF